MEVVELSIAVGVVAAKEVCGIGMCYCVIIVVRVWYLDMRFEHTSSGVANQDTSRSKEEEKGGRVQFASKLCIAGRCILDRHFEIAGYNGFKGGMKTYFTSATPIQLDL